MKPHVPTGAPFAAPHSPRINDSGSMKLESFGRQIVLTLEIEEGLLRYGLSRCGWVVVEPSPFGITVDGVDLGQGVGIIDVQCRSIEEDYATRGNHPDAHCRANVCEVTLRHLASGVVWILEIRVFDDGAGYRYRVPGEGKRHISGERSGWTIPHGSTVWIAERNNDWKLKSYAGWWIATTPEALPTVSSQGPVQAPPMVVKLPGEGGYTLFSEAALFNYSGMRLKAVGERRVVADFTEGEAGFEMEGEVLTPWRVTFAVPDLDALINCDILTHLCPPPDPILFADSSWIKPGRVTWRWWSLGTGTPAEELAFVRYARELGFEYCLVDDGWEAWPDHWAALRLICEAAREAGVGILVWKDYKEIANPADDYAQLRHFLDGIKDAGVSGVKIDFFNSEAKEKIDCQLAAFRETAARRLLLFFHGCQKPTGECRTWPHEVTREGIRGLELNKMAEGPIMASHNAALPFTRLAVGHGDYTPLGFSNPGDTTWAHQLATMILFTSPLNVIAENPEVLLTWEETRPVLELIKAIPTVWDETRVLEPSEIGAVAIMARRSGDRWFLAAINGTDERRTLRLNLAFLGSGTYRTLMAKSPEPRRIETSVQADINREAPLEITLERVDGIVALFTPDPSCP